MPGELSGRPGNVAEGAHFSMNFRSPAEIGPGWSLGRPREAPGRPQASPRHLQRSILRRFWIDFPPKFDQYWIDVCTIWGVSPTPNLPQHLHPHPPFHLDSGPSAVVVMAEGTGYIHITYVFMDRVNENESG